jgi:hypothetical protein
MKILNAFLLSAITWAVTLPVLGIVAILFPIFGIVGLLFKAGNKNFALSQIGTLAGGAGVVTTLTQNNVYQFIQVGLIDADVPVRQFNVTIEGEDTINVVGVTFVQAFAKLVTAGLLGADVKKAMILPVADGSAENARVQYRLTNDGATTPVIYGYGTAQFNAPVMAGMESIVALSNATFNEFTFLILDQTNIDKAIVTFLDGHTDEFTVTELAGLTCLSENILDADGLIAGRLIIDGQICSSIKIYATAGGNVQVCRVTLPFDVLTD